MFRYRHEIVFPHPVVLDRSFRDFDLDAAEQELLHRAPRGHGPFQWGYLLGVERPTVSFPHVDLIDRALVDAIDSMTEVDGLAFALSFFKVAAGPPPSEASGVHFDGFHFDTHPDITADAGVELDRVLINLAEFPRRIRYALTTRFDLARRGLPIDRGDYQVVELPADVDTREVVIPPRSHATVHGLRFLASVVPHVGVDDDGYFLASYERIQPITEAACLMAGQARYQGLQRSDGGYSTVKFAEQATYTSQNM
jgi:hypothetical protein